MDSRNFQPPVPMFDPNNLDEHFQILMDYDKHGNLRRVRKVRIHDTGTVLARIITAAFIIGGIISVYVFFFSSPR